MGNDLKYCPKCKTLRTSGMYCAICGEALISGEFPCPFCKYWNAVTSGFCADCGKPIQEEAKCFINDTLKKKEEGWQGIVKA